VGWCGESGWPRSWSLRRCVPMTAEEEAVAVTAAAVLIVRWWHRESSKVSSGRSAWVRLTNANLRSLGLNRLASTDSFDPQIWAGHRAVGESGTTSGASQAIAVLVEEWVRKWSGLSFGRRSTRWTILRKRDGRFYSACSSRGEEQR